MRQIKTIFLHHSLTRDSETVSWDAIRRYHTQALGWSDIGYHAGIELINDRYEILLGRPFSKTGAHTRGHNRNSIGICMVGNFDLYFPPDEQWNLTMNFIRDLMKIFKISKKHIFGHCEFSSKSCPGNTINMERLRMRL